MPHRKFVKPFLISIPHSGERIPVETPWLNLLAEPVLMSDVDRFVDRLYEPVIKELDIPSVKTEWHRYAADLNRLPDDVDADSVEGHVNPPGKFAHGLHWVTTMNNTKIMPAPIPRAVHDQIIEKYFEPFHRDVRSVMVSIREAGAQTLFHIDAHSMPSLGTSEHPDPGERRADIVISDCDGKSCSRFFKDLVISSYESAGFKVAYNWPYKGGRVTQTYGKPGLGQESIQVELNRALYMNEETKALTAPSLDGMQKKLKRAISLIYEALPSLPKS